MRPTDEQVKEFWEWCGELPERKQGYFAPDVRFVSHPPDLNNLFKYAVPKAIARLITTGIGIRNAWDKFLKIWMDFYFEGMDIETACYWAINEVIKNDR